jgi:hypothetical protein
MQCSRLRSQGTPRRMLLLQASRGGSQQEYNWPCKKRAASRALGPGMRFPGRALLNEWAPSLCTVFQRRDTDEMHLGHLLVRSTESPASVKLVKSSAEATHSSLGYEGILTFDNEDCDIDYYRTFILTHKRYRRFVFDWMVVQRRGGKLERRSTISTAREGTAARSTVLCSVRRSSANQDWASVSPRNRERDVAFVSIPLAPDRSNAKRCPNWAFQRQVAAEVAVARPFASGSSIRDHLFVKGGFVFFKYV